MSNNSDNSDNQAPPKAKSAKKAFSSGKGKKGAAGAGGAAGGGEFPVGARGMPVLFGPDELDLYCNKMTMEAYIFHGKPIDYKAIERMEYDPEDYTVDVIMKDGRVLDLGVKIQWLIRPYFSKAKEVQIVRTENKNPVDGHFVPLIHKTSP